MKGSKVLLRSGTYNAPVGGRLDATPARLRGWADKFRRMTAKGIRIPLVYGHQSKGLPVDPKQRRDEEQLWLSRMTAGYLEDLYLNDKGELAFKFDSPGCEIDDSGNLTTWTRLEDGREVKTAVGEVSAGIRNWTDGDGEKWDDAVIHVAVTPLPVVAGQEGFKALSTDADSPIYLSLTYLATETDMPEVPPFEKKKEDEAEGEVDKDHFADAVEILKKHGLHLADDTTPENILERICVAGHALHKAKGGPGLDEEEEEADEEAGVTPATEEQRPVMLSTISEAREPALYRLVARQQEQHKARALKRIDKLVKDQIMPVHVANKLREEFSGYELSLTATGEAEMKRADERLADWIEMSTLAPSVRHGPVARAREAPRPGSEDRSKDQEAMGDELAALAGAAPRKR